ncbi:GNAT family N-acetyltransferase [Paenibacillus sp. DCT19]|uniref:GNAT family N-acetyltransferase n=1 Tax=Paenibacillus sp. DCT19 TaxID=2211212 RepID=UPI0013E2CA83|nr:GNAT family N-acetyltransferase [Paenibacillus sp. DCT19]
MKLYRLATKNELHEVASLFTESFLDYPLFPLMLKSDKDYKKLLYQLNYINTKSYYQQNSCFVCVLEGKIVAAVLLKKRGEHGPNFFQYFFNGGIELTAQVGVRKLIYILRTLNKMKEACQRYGKDTWYIDSLAVANGFQGQRLGSSLFHSFIFPHISKQGGGRITLVTHTELNKRFYEKNGFSVFSEYNIGVSNHPITNFSFQQIIHSS